MSHCGVNAGPILPAYHLVARPGAPISPGTRPARPGQAAAVRGSGRARRLQTTPRPAPPPGRKRSPGRAVENGGRAQPMPNPAAIKAASAAGSMLSTIQGALGIARRPQGIPAVCEYRGQQRARRHPASPHPILTNKTLKPRLSPLSASRARPCDLEIGDQKIDDTWNNMAMVDAAANQHLASIVFRTDPQRDEPVRQEGEKIPPAAAMIKYVRTH